MKNIRALIQTIFVVVIWYCFYSIGGWRITESGGEKINLILLWGLYVLPMILIGIVLNGDVCISNVKCKKPIEKTNLFIWISFVLILIITPIALIQKVPDNNMFSENMQLAIYQKLNFSDIRGMGGYMATSLCVGHMVGILSEKPHLRKTMMRYTSIIFMWFFVYDILLPMTETMTKSGQNYMISTLLTIFPMLFAGIVLTYSGMGKSQERQMNKFYLILLIIVTLMAFAVPVVSVLMDLRISVYQSQNIIVSIIQFIQTSTLYIVLWLCVGNLAVRLKENK